ncbi:MAG: UDP-3-O-acyl-N-acetylglucosamine deacetylase [Planctomycetota bacterium]
MPIKRTTIERPFTIEGIGLFTGQDVSTHFKPNTTSTPGILIARDGSDPIAATIANRSDEPAHPAFGQMDARHTAIATAKGPAFTTEHALAALAGLGITDAIIELTGPEIPILDGSAIDFAEHLTAAGTTPLSAEINPITPTEPIEITSPDGTASITIEPIDADAAPHYRYELDYGSRIPACTADWKGDPQSFLESIAPARSFSLREEAQAMAQAGLFTRFTPADLLVLDHDAKPIDNTLRFENETAAHKLLDLIGDLALAGAPIHARITARRSGHAMNHAAAQRLAELSS